MQQTCSPLQMAIHRSIYTEQVNLAELDGKNAPYHLPFRESSDVLE
jgi:hypothetical protein